MGGSRGFGEHDLPAARGEAVTQIQSIVLYSKKGEVRRVDFRLNALNVITGSSGAGKSALMEIVEYCLGGEFSVPVGVIRNSVSWYGLLLKVHGGQILVLREAPEAVGGKTSQSVYVDIGNSLELPVFDDLAANTNVDGLIDILNRSAGFVDNVFEPEGATRESSEATFRHGLFFCLQHQDEIARRRGQYL